MTMYLQVFPPTLTFFPPGVVLVFHSEQKFQNWIPVESHADFTENSF